MNNLSSSHRWTFDSNLKSGLSDLSKRLSVYVDTSANPTTVRGEADGYNNGSARLGSYQLTIPIKKGEYYKILCSGGTSCGGLYFVGGQIFYFMPIGN